MTFFIISTQALKSLATGTSIGSIPNSTELYAHSKNGATSILHSEDKLGSQLLVFAAKSDSDDELLPEHLVAHQPAILSRLASFAERAARPGSLSLPRGWGQYKYRNYTSFFTSSATHHRSTVELLPGDHKDLVLWAISSTDSAPRLEDFSKDRQDLPSNHRLHWEEALSLSSEHFLRLQCSSIDEEDINLSPLASAPSKGWSYKTWMDSISPDQAAFVEAPADKTIRLRGPAGSGKTLAIILKAMTEVMRSRAEGVFPRVLIVTHSWSLAAQISDSIESMQEGPFLEIDTFPLLAVAQSISPQYVSDESGYSLLGEDSFSGKTAQLEQVLESLDEFIEGNWVSYRKTVSPTLRQRFESESQDDRLALAWDLLIEFGSVIGASAIFPGAGAEGKYLSLTRSSWMLDLASPQDLRVVFAVYATYMNSLDERSLLTADQVLADLLSHLETHAWNRARKSQGYDLIFVDEFHLFSPLERQVLHYMSRDVKSYPRVFLALDPRQSPSEAFIGSASDDTLTGSGISDTNFGEVSSFELTTVHRFTPQILQLTKHLHRSFPTLTLGAEWDVDFSNVTSSKSEGALPCITLAASSSGEEEEVLKAVEELYPLGQMAIAIVGKHAWPRYTQLARQLDATGRHRVSIITSRSETENLKYRSRGVVVAPVEYLAGLQFDTILLVGLPDLTSITLRTDRTRILSLLYLGVSRAEKRVRIFVNEHDGGVSELFTSAVDQKILDFVRGSLV